MTENKRFIQKDEAIINTITDELVTASSEDSAEIIVYWLNNLINKLNEQEETIQEYKHLVKIATSLIEWNTIPQIRREWQKHLSKVSNVLNEQEELIKRLKTIREEQIETILKQKRKMQELETRNKRQYERLKELTELMYERQWGKLENMVEEWEKQDELLEQEWGTYCENK